MLPMTMKMNKTSAAPVQAMTSATAPRLVPVRRAPSARPIPAKPMGTSTTLHSAAQHAGHPALVRVPQSQAAKNARRDRMVLEHLPLVKAIAVRVHENLPVHVDLDDLVHAGILGLFDAANKFNPWGKRCAEVLETVAAGGEPPRAS